MNVAFIHSGFSNSGGIERAVSIILNELCKNDNYHLLSIEYLKENPKSVEIDDRVRRFHLYSAPLSMTKAMFAGNAIKMTKKILRENDVHIVIGCGVLYFPLTIMAGKLTRTKTICWEHTNPKISSDYKFQKQLRNFGLKHSDANILITKKAKKYYDSIKKKRNVLIYNPVDKRLFAECTAYDADSQKIISVGRLCYAKNYDLLIRIAEQVLSVHSSWTWDIYGCGEEFERLQTLISKTSVSNRLTLKGNALNIYELYPLYSFLVMTSRYEGFPMVLLEAAAKALPMVSFDIETGPNEIIVDGVNGCLINANDTQMMAQRIDDLICDAEKRKKMSAGAYNTALKFSVERICEQWRELLENIEMR